MFKKKTDKVSFTGIFIENDTQSKQIENLI